MKRFVGALASCAIVALSTTASAQSIEDIVVPTGDGDTFTINHDALESMSPMDQHFTQQVLMNMPNYTTQAISIPGLSADCTVHKKWIVPTGADCEIKVSATGAALLDALPTGPLVTALCAAITAETGDLLEPVCALLLNTVVSSVIKPAIHGCVEKNEGVQIGLDFNLVPPRLHPNAGCN